MRLDEIGDDGSFAELRLHGPRIGVEIEEAPATSDGGDQVSNVLELELEHDRCRLRRDRASARCRSTPEEDAASRG